MSGSELGGGNGGGNLKNSLFQEIWYPDDVSSDEASLDDAYQDKTSNR
jgi:hypothetical protein